MIPFPLLGAIGSLAAAPLFCPHDLLVREEQPWTRQGTLALLLRVEGMADSRTLDIPRGRYVESFFLRGPAFDLQLYFTAHGAGGLAVLFKGADGRTKRVAAPLVRLRGDRTYHVALTWDLDTGDAVLYFNGVDQGDLSHWGADAGGLLLDTEAPLRLSGRFGGNDDLRLWLGGLTRTDHRLAEAEIARLPELQGIEPLVDEGRVLFDGPLDLSGLALEELFCTDFATTRPELIAEDALFEDGRRVRLPGPDAWVVEGPVAWEWRADGLNMTAQAGAPGAPGHWVLWHTREFPDDILIEYAFTPEDNRRGLNIVFLAAHHPGGESIFDLELPRRAGHFPLYTSGAINSYHISPWATDGASLRRTSNMRKNSGFHLVARGDDVIGGSARSPHVVRVLKHGPRVEMEADGVKCLKFIDDGRTYGPVHGAGNIGIRFMAHTGSVTLHHLRVWAVSRSAE